MDVLGVMRWVISEIQMEQADAKHEVHPQFKKKKRRKEPVKTEEVPLSEKHTMLCGIPQGSFATCVAV